MSKNEAFVPLLVSVKDAFTRATPAQVQAAALLLFYCNEQRNGGRISRAMVDDRVAMGALIAADVRSELDKKCELWHWEENSLVLDCYSVAHEEKASSTSERMKVLAGTRWKGHKTNKKGKRGCGTHSGTQCDTDSEAQCGTQCRQTDRRQSSSFSSKKKKTDREDTDTSLSLSGSSDSDGQVSLNSEKETKQETAADEEPRLVGPEAAAALRDVVAEAMKED